MDNLLPCAHCGSQDIGGSFSDNMYCYQCGASAPGLDAWNTRHTPKGWQLVPVDPTDGMIMGGHHQIDWVRPNQNTHYPEHESHIGSTCKSDMTRAYKRMLAAAPKWGGE